MATCPEGKYRNGIQAIEFAKNAVTLNREADFLDTLAASYAETENFSDAIEAQKRAINALIEEGETEKLVEYNAHLVCYKTYNPWRKTRMILLRSPLFRIAGDFLS